MASSSKKFLFLGCLLYFAVLLVNDGFMALDEYWVGITRYIPAQTSSVSRLVAPDDVKSPLQMLPMHLVAQGALAAGVTDPYWQYRAVIFFLGLVSVALVFFSMLRFAAIERLSEKQTNLLLLMMTFYFAAPFGLTRPMFESVAAPWLTLAAVFALDYDYREDLAALLWGTFFASMAFVLRQQLGICALVFVILPLLKKNWRHFFLASALGLLFFVLSGIPDHFLRGKFHFSLLNLTVYNYEHGSEYGQQSVLFYPALIFVVALVPFFIKRYPEGFLTNYFIKFRSLLMILFLFVFLHSLFPNKWERFIISLLPLFVLLLFPFLFFLQSKFKENRVRLTALYALNFLLFFLASFFPAQKNLIEMSRYLAVHPEVKVVHRVSDTPGWITEAFILNKNHTWVESSRELLLAENWKDCSKSFVVGAAQAGEYGDITKNLELNAVFDVNLIEQLSFKLNPGKNLRRVQLKLYSGCKRS
jgi:hypothetical protein